MRFAPTHLVVCGLLLAAAPTSAADFTVVGIGTSAYRINGVDNPTLSLVRGVTYTFDVNASGHPFWIKTSAVLGTGSAFTTGVTGNGTQVGTVTFAVPESAPSTLVYICQFHAPMTGTLQISGTSAVDAATWSAIKRLFD